MHTLVIIILALAIYTNSQFTYGAAGRVFPIPLTEFVEDPHLLNCPDDDGFHAHRTNCSLFHACKDRMHKIYTCIDGFFYNPHQGQCQYIQTDREVRCDDILQRMPTSRAIPVVNGISETYGYTGDMTDHHRKSITTECVQPGVYPDRLDCSLFHYCRGNLLHEVFKCPDDMHFDPKTLLCAAPELVDCQYEPVLRTEDDFDQICRQHPPGTYLPVFDRLDMYLICAEDGRSVLKRCEDGHLYHALTTACQKGSCTFDPTLCQNNGQCIDEPTMKKGFKCMCPEPFRGEYCEGTVDRAETIEEGDQTSSSDLFRGTRLDETTHIPPAELTSYALDNQSTEDNVNFDRLQHRESSLRQALLANLEEQSEQRIQAIFLIAAIFIGLILIISIIFGIVIFTRVIPHASTNTIHPWKALREESNV